mmetsp:Transcript_10070/g.23214  ORF Transcript_10070/g.23214 Transcript_10070/m.23214 type:complete len:109 (+) Transcript_10070:865-1191(+)
MDLDHGAVGTYEPETPPDWALEGTNLANERLGTTVLFATDEWFARAESLLNPLPATFDPDAYSPQGKTLDGWESRRRRLPGRRFCWGWWSGRPHARPSGSHSGSQSGQ